MCVPLFISIYFALGAFIGFYLPPSPVLQSISLGLSFVSVSLPLSSSPSSLSPSPRLSPSSPSPPVGGSGGDSARRGERSDVQGVFAVGVCGQPADAAGGPDGSPERGPGRLGSGSGRHHAAPSFHEVRPLTTNAPPQTHLHKLDSTNSLAQTL